MTPKGILRWIYLGFCWLIFLYSIIEVCLGKANRLTTILVFICCCLLVVRFFLLPIIFDYIRYREYKKEFDYFKLIYEAALSTGNTEEYEAIRIFGTFLLVFGIALTESDLDEIYKRKISVILQDTMELMESIPA